MRHSGNSTAFHHAPAAIVLALSAAGVLEVARIEAQGPSLSMLAGLLAAALALPLVRYLLRRFAGGRPISWMALTALVAALAIVPMLAELACDGLLHRGQPLEFYLHVLLRNLTFGLLALPPAMNLQRLGCLSSLFLLVFASSLGSSPLRWPLIVVYGLAGIWWLAETHWRPLAGCLVAEAPRRWPWRTAVLAAAAAPIAVLSLVCSRPTTTTALTGWLPTSGGTRWSSDTARGGVGNGDALVAATNDAASVGPVESDLFLASDMPSLYDMFNDMYGQPPLKMKKKVEHTVALAGLPRRQREKHLSQSEQLQREFSAVRNGRPPQPQKPPPDRPAKALFYLGGRTPLHLRMETFDTFDGIDWRHGATPPGDAGQRANAPTGRTSGPAREKLSMKAIDFLPWLDTGLILEPRFAGEPETHEIRTTRLNSNRIPAPLDLARLHIDKVELVSFFRWSEDGVLAMDRESIPAFTAIRLQSYVADPEVLAAAGSCPAAADADALDLAVPKTEARGRIGELAQSLVAGMPQGWSQVAAVVEHLRRQMALDPRATAPAGCQDAVDHFLFHVRRGPDYLFASAAAVLLRSLGYPTRLVTGFYAAPGNFDRESHHTPVTPDDVHVWAEVCLGRGTWVTIEPTPGYEILLPRRTLLQICRLALAAAASWCARHALLLAWLGGLIAAAVYLRRELLDRCLLAAWHVGGLAGAKARITLTLWLLECRTRFAGRGRPAHEPLARWYAPLAACEPGPIGQTLDSAIALAQWNLYAACAAGQPAPPWTPAEIEGICRRAIRTWTLRRFRRPGSRWAMAVSLTNPDSSAPSAASVSGTRTIDCEVA